MAAGVGTRVLDLGLNVLDVEADRLYLCSSEPTTFTEASSTFALGNKAGAAGSICGSPTAATPNGRKVSTAAITDGSITATGTASWYAIVDFANSRLLAKGAVTPPVAVTSGQPFTFNSVAVTIPAAVVSGFSSPASLAGLRGWWSPIDSVGGDLSTLVVADKSGVNPNNHNLDFTAGMTYSATALNGHPGWVVSGNKGAVTNTTAGTNGQSGPVGTRYVTTSFDIGTTADFAMFMVMAITVTGADFYPMIFQYLYPGHTTPWYTDPANFGTNMIAQTQEINWGGGGAGATIDTNPHRLIFTQHSGVADLWVDGIKVATSAGNNTTLGNPGILAFDIDQDALSGGLSNPVYGDLFVTNVVPPDANMPAIDTWMKNKYGL